MGHTDCTVIVAGPKPTERDQEIAQEKTTHKLIFIGEVHGDEQLSLLYSAANVTVVPSREDNMPLSAMESQSCGTPVVAFSIGGLPDIVKQKESGFLVDIGNPAELMVGINWAISSASRDAVRNHAMSTWSPSVITPQLMEIYSTALGK